MKYIVCDLDGTVADASHRLHHIKGPSKDWASFYAACLDDTLKYPVWKLLLLTAYSGQEILYVTGRSEECRDDTLTWLERHHFPAGRLLMRKQGDHRQDYIIKREMADEFDLTPATVWFVLEDRDQVVEMWRSRGILCLQVADGDF
jgi:hypothetical protein